ncbi:MULTISPECIES: hypothetical protein [Enterococcus]|uniref:Uncharacterized protein n=2 Tax=Enterococcus faecium TaxID=1352 RepID=A0A242BL84_ENTFC|nr:MULTISPECIES: hypothetical protein [Enterococcus]EGP5689087.1 hypothetical protein [Enterococcus faecium]EJY46738.1 hypothetical protein HMPREF1348_00790 [Enterococcus faecium 505]EME7220234.1 hypothetical protein [Enterococcus faecium]EME8087353.1 hypothetical protein [Enterococcus faecium]EME8111864.1 hypothetical protein [Enterococcus faecium]
MYYVEVKTKGVKNKQYVKGMSNEYPLLGSWKEAAPFSKPCAIKIKNELEKELTCGKAVVEIIEK